MQHSLITFNKNCIFFCGQLHVVKLWEPVQLHARAVQPAIINYMY